MSIRLLADDHTLRTQFSLVTDVHDVAQLLEVKTSELCFYIYKAHKYRVFYINKQSGGKRVIYSPANALKIIQRKLNQVLQAVYRGRGPVHGFSRAKSIRTNAQRHLGCRILLNFDLKDFFPSIHFGRVNGMFQAKPYNLPEAASRVLAQICCHHGHLPAGAPTSPIVANMVCGRLDAQLKELAQGHGCFYTRYADDITFSTRSQRLPPQIAYREDTYRRWVVGEQLTNVIHNNNFTINASKTRVCSRRTRQEVTGLVINDRVNVRRTLIRQVRAMLNALHRYGRDAAQAEFVAKYNQKQRFNQNPDFQRVMRGKLDFIGAIRGRDDELFLALLERYSRLSPAFTVRTVTLGVGSADKALARAIWLLEDENGIQGTAFAAAGYGLLTAAHVVEHAKVSPMYASRPAFRAEKYKVVVDKLHAETDVAQLHIDASIPVQLAVAMAAILQQGQQITLAGFPRYHVGDSVHINRGPIIQTRTYMGVPHFIIQPTIVQGNSGGPVLDDKNRVVGIAVKGLGTPGRFSKFDELSSFVPASVLTHLA